MTSNEVATTAGSSLAISNEQDFWTDKQRAALVQLGVTDATNGDLAVFFHQCQRTGLDPFARQIYMIGRKERGQIKQTIQTGIDGFRLIARRSGQLDGYEDTLWCGADGQWVDVWLKSEQPAAAKVTVIRNGGRFPAVALFSEYAGTKFDGGLTKMWETKGALMLAKCAEALALRKAFPQDLSGLYTSDEMQPANVIDEDGNPAPPQQRRPAQRQQSIAEALGAEPQVTVDVDSLLAAVEQAPDDDALRELWRQTAPLPAEGQTLVRDLIQARLDDLKTAAAEPEPEQPTLDAEPIEAEVVA